MEIPDNPIQPVEGNEEVQQTLEESLPEKHKNAFRELRQRCRTEDLFIRYAQVRTWKKAEEFWHGIQFIYWSEIAHEWRTPENLVETSEEARDDAGPFYDYAINIYKAHGESVIAALSQQVPNIEYFPDDAELADDISTAKTKTKIAVLIQKHNAAKLRLMEALHKLFNAGLVASYVYNKADLEFGKREVPKYDKQSFDVNYQDCPICGQRLGEHNPEMGQSQLTADGPVVAPLTTCPTCQSEVNPTINTEQEERIVQVGVEEVPKNRTIIEIFGPLNVKVPYYAREQKDCGYILQFLEVNFGLARDIYPDIRDKIRPEYSVADTDRWTRTPSSFASAPRGVDNITNLVTLEKLWLRPWMFETLDDKEVALELKTQYKNGCKVVFINDVIAEVVDENMDDYWEIGKAGPSSYIHSDGMGASLIPVQELRNVGVNLGIETIEHGIPSQFADPRVLNFDEYSHSEIAPGNVYPAEPLPGQKIGDAFHESKTATLSKEVEPFMEKLDQDGQFVTGSFPSIYGGPTEASSRTAAEYNMSRQQALQRLSIAWEYIRIWWTRTINKSVNCFIKHMIDDTRLVTKEGDIYQNILIKRSDLIGKANIEPEASEHFPISSSQKNDILIKLMQLQIPEVQAVVAAPENSGQVADALGFPELHIPGNEQRYKQLAEIAEMIRISGDIDESMLPTVKNEDGIDDDEIHSDICKVFLCSERGQNLKKINPAAYMNVYAHLQLHNTILQQQAMQQAQMQVQQSKPNEVAQ